jgi:hypothetical protein
MFSKLNTFVSLDDTKYKFPYFQNFDLNNVEALHFVSYPPCRKLWKYYIDTLNFRNINDLPLLETFKTNVTFNLENPIHNNSSYLLEFNKEILLEIKIYNLNDKYIKLNFQWNLPEGKYLSHIFKISDTEYFFDSKNEGTIYIHKLKEPILIYHTYDWYGSTDWKLIHILNIE